MGKGARFPLDYFVVTGLSDEKFGQKEESVKKCREIALTRVKEEAECLLTQLQTAGSRGLSNGDSKEIQSNDFLTKSPSIVEQLLQAIAGPLIALTLTFIFMLWNGKFHTDIQGKD